MDDDSDSESVDLSNSQSSYMDFKHPNEPVHDPEARKRRHMHVYKGCAKYLHRFDELIMKPMFIYKYEKTIQKKAKEFFKHFMKHGDEVEQEFHDELR